MADQVTAVLEVPVTLAVKASVPPGCRLELLGETETAMTGLTVTTQLADFVPSAALVAVMVAEPAATAVTKPEEETVATDELLLDQLTFLFVALDGSTVATRVSAPPTVRLVVVLFRLTLETVTSLTVTVAVSDLVVSAWLVAVTMNVPAAAGAV